MVRSVVHEESPISLPTKRRRKASEAASGSDAASPSTEAVPSEN